MMSLFSMFDMIFYKWNIIVLFLISIFFTPYVFKFSFEKMGLIFFFCFISLFFNSLNPNKSPKMFFFLMNSLIFSIFILNILSIGPSFSFTSQISVVMIISLTFYLSFIFFSLFRNFKGFISHLIPEGSPIILTPFLFLIEIVSNSIRPVTLTVRLVANIMAGHLLMLLLSKIVFIFFPSWLSFLILNMVELFVSIIQAYIFTVMISLYHFEIS